MAELLEFVSNSNRGRGKRGLGEGVGSKGRDTCSLFPPQFLKSELSLEFPTSPKTKGPKHSTAAAGSPGERTTQIASTSTESSVGRYHTNA